MCPWCTIDDERAARRQRQAWSNPPSAPQRTVPLRATTKPTGPQHTVSPQPEPDKIFGLSHRAYLTTLAVIVTVVVALASFIVWALLSGASTFGISG